MPVFEIDLVAQAEPWGDGNTWQRLFDKAAAQIFLELPQPDDVQVSVLLSNDVEIALYNERWRGKPAPTNVLSFPATGPARVTGFLGDIVLSYETLACEAQEQQKDLQNHALHLFVHGLLHLLGHDHETARDAEAMEALERKILLELGVSDPYEE